MALNLIEKVAVTVAPAPATGTSRMLTAPVGTGRTTRERAAVVVASRWQIQEPQRQHTVRHQKLRMENSRRRWGLRACQSRQPKAWRVGWRNTPEKQQRRWQQGLCQEGRIPLLNSRRVELSIRRIIHLCSIQLRLSFFPY